jgi:hypothetical protein
MMAMRLPGEDGLSMQSLHDAIMEALLNGGLLSEDTLERSARQGLADERGCRGAA